MDLHEEAAKQHERCDEHSCERKPRRHPGEKHDGARREDDGARQADQDERGDDRDPPAHVTAEERAFLEPAREIACLLERPEHHHGCLPGRGLQDT
jgi:hypothetical protein